LEFQAIFTLLSPRYGMFSYKNCLCNIGTSNYGKNAKVGKRALFKYWRLGRGWVFRMRIQVYKWGFEFWFGVEGLMVSVQDLEKIDISVPFF